MPGRKFWESRTWFHKNQIVNIEKQKYGFRKNQTRWEQGEFFTELTSFIVTLKKYYCSTIKSHNISLKTQPLDPKIFVQ